MGHTREKKPIAYTVDAQNEAKCIVEYFPEFVEGVRVIMLIHRSKDGASHASRHLRMFFTNGKKEFEEALGCLLEDRSRSSIEGLRIYSTVNCRDMKKAVRQFKHDLLDNDDADYESWLYFFLGIKSRMSSAMMRPSSRGETFFKFDVDNPLTLDRALAIFEESGVSDQIVKQYPTKNGWHIITKPFNYTTMTEQIPMEKDGLLLLKY
ncbi:MAG: hypothetical protein WDN67_00705 [Candidatus Moraniibacteriota bacterium]